MQREMTTSKGTEAHPEPPQPFQPPPSSLKALVVEDDASIAEFIRVGLGYERFEVTVCVDGLEAVRTAERVRPDLVVLDWMLPGMDGLEVCRRLSAFGDPAIVMLTAKDALADRVAGLEMGADDYVVKPFQFEELVARIRAVLRRRASQTRTAPSFAGITLDPRTREVTRNDQPIELSPREFDLLRLFLEQPRRVFTKQQILEQVWGYDFAGSDNIVEVYVGYLREKLGDRSPARLLRTVRGVGYTLRDDG
ncbi:MAG: Two-component transcriptional response regulator, LuxR family [uncultured Chloroflexi bacterium]|uniref:Two-component transcriptional response regulator, LuxR family n=1 Tax=uncultured Chloroflexota bacterium TaxID=166587 RepID=A0A6J4JSC2_9CHLR|nr:MAG: Two-component transcriptional response regulator, LuxR family [uncultured Chloroflexota bacterium]